MTLNWQEIASRYWLMAPGPAEEGPPPEMELEPDESREVWKDSIAAVMGASSVGLGIAMQPTDEGPVRVRAIPESADS